MVHTWNLHGNFGPGLALGEIEAFADEIDEEVDGAVTLETVDWIWDQYLQRTQGRTKRYDTANRPTTCEMPEYKGDELRWWVERYEQAKSRG